MKKDTKLKLVVTTKVFLAVTLTTFGVWIGFQILTHPLGQTFMERLSVCAVGVAIIGSCLILAAQMINEARQDWRER